MISSVKALRVHQIRSKMLVNRLQTQWEPKDLYTKYVQRLLIDNLQLAPILLPLCKNLTSLAIGLNPDEAGQAVMHPLFTSNTLSFPKLRRLWLFWGILPPRRRSFRSSIFKSLTHLEVDLGNDKYWSGLSSLKNLTNLRLNIRNTHIENASQIEDVLHRIIYIILPNLPPSLKYFTVLFEPRYAAYTASKSCTQICWDIEIGKYDSRLLLDWSGFAPSQVVIGQFILSRNLDLLNSWTYSSRCYMDCWRRAELEIENRNRRYGSV